MKGLYVHIPFCVKKCRYCDFVSFSDCDWDKDRYLDALFSEFGQYKGMECDTVFIGGGTPTSLSKDQLERLLWAINRCFSITAGCEFTIEANPKTLDMDKLSVLKKGGVNRLSLGIQSFDNDELKVIGRIHTAKDAIDTFKLARKQDFDNISLDLMSALPDQTMESFKRNIDNAIGLNPEHISCYSLIPEEGTPIYSEFEQGKLQLPDEEAEREMYEYACEALEKSGYVQYEISNFAKRGRASKHNMKYWQCHEYIGTGLAAHSYVEGMRFSNTSDLKQYLMGYYKNDDCEVLDENDKMSEFMFMGLRMTEGVSEVEFSERFGKNIDDIFGNTLLKYINLGMIKREKGRIFLAHGALSVSNTIMCEFIL